MNVNPTRGKSRFEDFFKELAEKKKQEAAASERSADQGPSQGESSTSQADISLDDRVHTRFGASPPMLSAFFALNVGGGGNALEETPTEGNAGSDVNDARSVHLTTDTILTQPSMKQAVPPQANLGEWAATTRNETATSRKSAFQTRNLFDMLELARDDEAESDDREDDGESEGGVTLDVSSPDEVKGKGKEALLELGDNPTELQRWHTVATDVADKVELTEVTEGDDTADPSLTKTKKKKNKNRNKNRNKKKTTKARSPGDQETETSTILTTTDEQEEATASTTGTATGHTRLLSSPQALRARSAINGYVDSLIDNGMHIAGTFGSNVETLFEQQLEGAVASRTIVQSDLKPLLEIVKIKSGFYEAELSAQEAQTRVSNLQKSLSRRGRLKADEYCQVLSFLHEDASVQSPIESRYPTRDEEDDQLLWARTQTALRGMVEDEEIEESDVTPLLTYLKVAVDSEENRLMPSDIRSRVMEDAFSSMTEKGKKKVNGIWDDI